MEPEREGQKAPEMTAAEKTRVARKLDERVQTLTSAGLDDVTLFAVMSEHMTEFKRLLDAAEPGELDRLGQHFPAFGHYVAVLSSIAVALRDGAIEIPR